MKDHQGPDSEIIHPPVTDDVREKLREKARTHLLTKRRDMIARMSARAIKPSQKRKLK
jgi:hypothetical protein